MKTRRPFNFLSVLLGSVLLFAGCAHRQEAATPRQLFAKVKVGMSRSEVDAVLGPPSQPQPSPEGHAWYLPPPRLEPWESPFAPGTIGVRFGDDGRVASKLLNPQCKE